MRQWKRAAALGALLGTAPGAGPAGAQETAFDVTVALTPRAADHFAETGEGIVVLGWYYGEPTPEAAGEANEVGLIDVAREERQLGSAGGAVLIGGAGLDPERAAWVAGPLNVNVNVWSARLTSPDNLLACDFFDGPLASATGGPVTLTCGLITEGYAPATRP